MKKVQFGETAWIGFGIVVANSKAVDEEKKGVLGFEGILERFSRFVLLSGERIVGVGIGDD